MRLLNILICLAILIGIQQAAFSFTFPKWGDFDNGVITKLERKTDSSMKSKRTLPEYKWKNLRTTFVRGVYCQQVADDGTYRNQKHYFYNKKTQEMIEIQGMYFISNTNQLGEYKETFDKYGAKSDTFKYNGKTYTIPNVMGHKYLQ